MTKIYAHRGYSARFVENTMPAFRGASKAGADGIELDVRLSRDGELVVFHDQKLRRMADWYGKVEDKSAYVLQKIPLVRRGQTGTMPLLREYLDWAAEEGVVTNIELKSDKNDGELERRVVALVRELDLVEQVFFSSFSIDSVQLLKEIAPEIKVGYLSSLSSEKVIEKTAQWGLEYFHPSYKQLTRERVKYAQSLGLEVNVWTANQADLICELLGWGVDGIITNEVERALALRDGECQ